MTRLACLLFALAGLAAAVTVSPTPMPAPSNLYQVRLTVVGGIPCSQGASAQLDAVYTTNSTILVYVNADAVPHLTGITPSSGAERWSFSYLGNQALYSPFSPPSYFGTTSLLLQASYVNTGQTYTFEHAGNSGELSKVTLPYGGSLRWTYRSFTYSTGIR